MTHAAGGASEPDEGWMVTVPIAGVAALGSRVDVVVLSDDERAVLRELGVESVIVAGSDVRLFTVTLEREAASSDEVERAVALASEAIRNIHEWRDWPVPLAAAGPVRAVWCAGRDG